MNQNKQECYALSGSVQCVCVWEREIDSDGDYVVSVIVMHSKHSAFCILTYLNMHTKTTVVHLSVN